MRHLAFKSRFIHIRFEFGVTFRWIVINHDENSQKSLKVVIDLYMVHVNVFLHTYMYIQYIALKRL